MGVSLYTSMTADTTINTVPAVSLIERVERALLLVAYLVEIDGDIHLPLYERLEVELHDLRRMDGTRERARRLLMNYNGLTGGLNGSRSRNLRLSASGGRQPYLES